jgi:hypothetical protein
LGLAGKGKYSQQQCCAQRCAGNFFSHNWLVLERKGSEKKLNSYLSPGRWQGDEK